jgi:hypothetical protein
MTTHTDENTQDAAFTEVEMTQSDALYEFHWHVRNSRNRLERELREEAVRRFGPTLGNDIIL